MAKSEFKLPTCPVDHPDCHWLPQLSLLRQENEELKLLVTMDPLTGLYNYRFFRQSLEIELSCSNRSARPTSLMMIDLDHFKSINDQWGHEVGNLALQNAARVFNQTLRQSDIICRYGGEEFAVILPQTALPLAVNVAERLRQNLEQTAVEFDGNEIYVTASIGVGVYQRSNEFTAESFVEATDGYMYQAKKQGRNQVCHAAFESTESQTAVSADERAALFSPMDEDE